MKKILLSLIVSLVAVITNAQHFENGSKFFHAGVGVLSPYAYSGSKMGIPPVHASFEIGVTDKIGVGGLIGYTTSKSESAFWNTKYSWKYSYLIVGVRGNYHFYQDDKFDVYGGAMLGYNIASAKFESNDKTLENWVTEPKVGGLAFGVYAGGRYFFKENSALFVELGYSIAWLNIGYCAKF
jgi:hypothetical protein